MRGHAHCHFIWPAYAETIRGEGRNTVTRKLALIAALLVALGGLSAGFAIAASGGPARGAGVTASEDEANESNESNGSLTGSAAEKAADAALAAVGAGPCSRQSPRTTTEPPTRWRFASPMEASWR
jgi:hypothetical protein